MGLTSSPWRWANRWWRWGLLVLVLLIGLDGLLYLLAERLWFQEVNYLSVFWLRVRSQILLGAFPVLLTLIFTWGNLILALRLKPLPRPDATDARQRGLALGGLLSLSMILSLLVGVQLFYQGQIAADVWQQDLSLYDTNAPPPLWPRLSSVTAMIQSFVAQPWQLVALGVSTVAFLIYPRWLSRLAALLMSLGFGLILSNQWPNVLLALNPTPFFQNDPIFHRDIGFYIFRLPLWELLEFWLLGVVFFTLANVCLIYLLADNSLSRGRFYGFSGSQRQHLYTLAGLLFLTTSLSHWISRFEILYSQEGVVYGAGYTDTHVLLPMQTVLVVLTLMMGLLFLWRGLVWHPRSLKLEGIVPGPKHHPLRSLFQDLADTSVLVRWISLYLLLALVGLVIAPQLVQRLVVQPNELERERPYITNSIDLTRAAFDLANIDSEPFDPNGELSVQDLQQNVLTLENIRLWDTRPLLESNRQLQQIRLYYEFKDADVDRYNIFNPQADPQTDLQTDTQTNIPLPAQTALDRRQVLVSARELNYAGVPDIAKTWVNEHLVYTHGYGFTMSPVNTASPDGLPAYFVRGIDHVPSNEAVRNSIPIGEPRLYYGELTDTYILTHTRVPELDYPSGNDNVYTTYRGRGGINVGRYHHRLLFARRLLDWRMLFSEDILPDTRLLYRRTIADRVQAIAPFLRFDTDPYLVITDIGESTDHWGSGTGYGTDPDANPGLDSLQPRSGEVRSENFDEQTSENYLYWIIDAYTVSDRFPYSDLHGNDFNYIRNSVKVVIDAYNGAISFFVTDPEDPIIQSWSRLLPHTFRPLLEMPAALRDHIRYPQDLFQVQADVLMTYHMTDPQVFYNREDQWRAPNEIYANEAQRVQPYYLIMKLPDEAREEFILLRLFTPAQRNNLVGWLAARSDGNRYGLRLLYQFPKQELVFGPEQIEARINQDPAISQRVSLWNTQGSRAQQGNLLVIPIERSLLYVEPLYLVAEQNQLPALTRVIMVYKNRIAMAETLADTLSAIFYQEPTPTPPILRELRTDTSGEAALPGLPELEGNQDSPDQAPSDLLIP